MSFITDIREVSESAMGQVAERFSDLPRPLLAAIGAGDFAVERLAELREALTSGMESAPSAGSARYVAEVREFAGELPHKFQEAAAGVVESVQKFAADAPARTQQLVAQLPDRISEMREALSPEQFKGAVEAYTQLAGTIYGSLADRGDRTWHKVVAEVKVVEAAPEPTPAPASKNGATQTVTPAPAKPAPAKPATAESIASPVPAQVPKAAKSRAAKPAARRSATVKPDPIPAAQAAVKAAVAAVAETKPESTVESVIAAPEADDPLVWTSETSQSPDSTN